MALLTCLDYRNISYGRVELGGYVQKFGKMGIGLWLLLLMGLMQIEIDKYTEVKGVQHWLWVQDYNPLL